MAAAIGMYPMGGGQQGTMGRPVPQDRWGGAYPPTGMQTGGKESFGSNPLTTPRPIQEFLGPPMRPLNMGTFGAEQEVINLEQSYGASGNNNYLVQTVIRQMTRDDVFWLSILPLFKTENVNRLDYSEIEFVEPGLLDERPDQGVTRLVSSKRRARSFGFKSYGKSLMMEVGRLYTAEGQQEFIYHMKQITNSTLETACYGVAIALLSVNDPDFNQEGILDGADGYFEFQQRLELEVRLFDVIHRTNGLAMAVDEAARILQRKGHTANTSVVPYGSLTAAAGANANPYEKQAPTPSLGGVSLFQSRYFMRGENDAQDPFFRKREIGSYIFMDGSSFINYPKDVYTTECRDVDTWDEARDNFVRVSIRDAIAKCGINRSDGNGNGRIGDILNDYNITTWKEFHDFNDDTRRAWKAWKAAITKTHSVAAVMSAINDIAASAGPFTGLNAAGATGSVFGIKGPDIEVKLTGLGLTTNADKVAAVIGAQILRDNGGSASAAARKVIGDQYDDAKVDAARVVVAYAYAWADENADQLDKFVAEIISATDHFDGTSGTVPEGGSVLEWYRLDNLDMGLFTAIKELSEQIVDPPSADEDVKSGASSLDLIPISSNLPLACANINVPIPLSIIEFLPHATFRTGSMVVLDKTGVGRTHFGHVKMLQSIQTQTMMYNASFSMRMKSVVEQTRQVQVLRDVLVRGYEGGLSPQRAFNANDQSHRDAYRQGDTMGLSGFFCAVPLGWRPVGMRLDLTGSLPWASNYRGNRDAELGSYPYAEIYANFWGWQVAPDPLNLTYNVPLQYGPHNTVCFQFVQKNWRFDGHGGSWSDLQVNTGHLGQDLVPGCAKVRTGAKPSYDANNYNHTQPRR